MTRIVFTLTFIAALVWPGQAVWANNVRIKDLVDVQGVRGNDLVGYGLVVGLNGSGDTIRNSPYTEDALAVMLESLGINVQDVEFRSKNIAAVLVTAELPAFARQGSRIDINVSSIGDAKSLQGGTLILTPLKGPDGHIYAAAQGSVLVSGFSADGEAASLIEGVPTSGSIPNGARVEKEIGFQFQKLPKLRLTLRDPDFTTARRIEDVINEEFGSNYAQTLDSGTVEIALNHLGLSPVMVMSKVENLTVKPERKARIVIDQRSGTIVLGGDVQISTSAIAQGNLSISVRENPVVSQPNPFAAGQSIILPRSEINVTDGAPGNIAIVNDAVNLSEVVAGLNALGVTPREIIDILKAMKRAGALHAELIIQ